MDLTNIVEDRNNIPPEKISADIKEVCRIVEDILVIKKLGVFPAPSRRNYCDKISYFLNNIGGKTKYYKDIILNYLKEHYMKNK